MHAEPKSHYKGYTIVASPVETIRRRFMAIFTIYESEHATFPLCHHQATETNGFLTVEQAVSNSFDNARKWIDDRHVAHIY
ncbi:hypothetical protein [Massilia sp.]|jgi:hypothetical protein|uniref:hypothetical protein n=1 Tax=Massilia sp. TaxID=1882437 RepID=UPI00289DC0EA|nr:hypothetical protein [Massilia sp.]